MYVICQTRAPRVQTQLKGKDDAAATCDARCQTASNMFISHTVFIN